jgi:hypothetical protein
MQNRRNCCIGGLILLSAVTMFVPSKAIAQSNFGSNSSNENIRSIPDAFESSFYGIRGRYGSRTSVLGEIAQRLFLYPDNAIVGDGNRVQNLYREVMNVQTLSDPFIRTPDLNNPFDRSLLTEPLPR